MNFPGIKPCNILLPSSKVDLEKWAVIACDQFTSQPEYWHEVEAIVGKEPSTLHLMQPEVFLGKNRTRAVNATMRRYLRNGTLKTAVEEGFILVERTTESGTRLGLVAALDLECYDYTTGELLVRATEGTVADRLPPRVKIREKAALELPHVLVLIDDFKRTVIEPLYAEKREAEPLYDVELMQGGGHLRGWAVDDDDSLRAISDALSALAETADGFLYAVGDGNHSLATAKKCWDEIKEELLPTEQATYPARYALVELENLHDEAIQFEPIHRVLFHVDGADVVSGFKAYVEREGMTLVEGDDIAFIDHGSYALDGANGRLPIAVLQSYLDFYLKKHNKAEIDYIHGEDAVRELSAAPDALGILLRGIPKDGFFEGIRVGGHLPRKTFSMGEAHEKRYYMECRKIRLK